MVISEKNEPLVRIPTILCVTLEDVMLMSWILARQLNYQCVMLCLQYGDIVRYLYLKSVCRSCWMSRKFPPFTMSLSGDSIISSAEITAVGKNLRYIGNLLYQCNNFAGGIDAVFAIPGAFWWRKVSFLEAPPSNSHHQDMLRLHVLKGIPVNLHFQLASLMVVVFKCISHLWHSCSGISTNLRLDVNSITSTIYMDFCSTRIPGWVGYSNWEWLLDVYVL